MNKQKHLNLEARILIETMLNEHHSFKSIARELGKDCTTISKEIKAHICFEKTGAFEKPELARAACRKPEVQTEERSVRDEQTV